MHESYSFVDPTIPWLPWGNQSFVIIYGYPSPHLLAYPKSSVPDSLALGKDNTRRISLGPQGQPCPIRVNRLFTQSWLINRSKIREAVVTSGMLLTSSISSSGPPPWIFRRTSCSLLSLRYHTMDNESKSSAYASASDSGNKDVRIIERHESTTSGQQVAIVG